MSAGVNRGHSWEPENENLKDNALKCMELRAQSSNTFYTVMLNLAEQQSGRFRPHPEVLYSTRAHSWRSKNNQSDFPPLHRSRTAYYDILRVSPSKDRHPDKNPDNEEASQRFSEISEAFSVLGSMALRRKYDHSIFSGSDVQESGRPSERESIYNTRASSPQQYQQQQRSPRFSNVGGKAMFDLDAFFQAHYGEQLQREKELRSRRAQYQQKQQHDYKQWKLGKMLEITVGVLLAMSGILKNSIKPQWIVYTEMFSFIRIPIGYSKCSSYCSWSPHKT
uniref:DnaJ (Hsp40) homolog, subfamily C, member 30b n=1 Tax=Oncorhynchus tshawytscha TaxID=74940 RepID=A0AAZ3PWQ7_ONCTS